MKRLGEVLTVIGAMILTGGGGYVVVVGHVARSNHTVGYIAVGVAVIGAGIFTIGLLMLRGRH